MKRFVDRCDPQSLPANQAAKSEVCATNVSVLDLSPLKSEAHVLTACVQIVVTFQVFFLSGRSGRVQCLSCHCSIRSTTILAWSCGYFKQITSNFETEIHGFIPNVAAYL